MCSLRIDTKATSEEDASETERTTDDPTGDHLLPNELSGIQGDP